MQVQRTESIESVQIAADADCLTSRAGTALLVGFADRIGLAGALSQAMGDVRKRRSRHDPGRTLRDLAVMLADGGDCLTDLSALRDQPTLFGDVPSDATAWRARAGGRHLQARFRLPSAACLRGGEAGGARRHPPAGQRRRQTAADHIELLDFALAHLPE